MTINRLYLNVGQMKAGTTFLHSLIRGSRGIYAPPIKEIHYFEHVYGERRALSDAYRLAQIQRLVTIAQKINRPIAGYAALLDWGRLYLAPVENRDWYSNLFASKGERQWAVDFSNLNCNLSVSAMQRIKDHADDIRITYCLRNPVSRAISHAKFALKFDGKDHELSQMGQADLKRIADQVEAQSASDLHIARLIEVFGVNNLRVIRSEDMWRDPDSTLARVADLLGLPGFKLVRADRNEGPRVPLSSQVTDYFTERFAGVSARVEKVLADHPVVLT